ncbi:MAG: PAS domain-containing protein [Betaproteobacteria bacterium AqS2]|uniref:histidine kinase n=1 Tax=Candidatus Amphirhobacter heronislandensis TaxID=1732024 RepID=A0A930UG85_9GAMM|nr:PAS domain-containing protein [Betaproteobacteria bacterium AqS2]
MDAAAQLGRRRFGLPALPGALLYGGSAAVLLLGLAATVLLIASIQYPSSALGAWLPSLLGASRLLPFAIGALLILTVLLFLRERTKIATSLLMLMLFQAALAIVMMLLVLFWVVNTTVTSSHDQAVDDSVALSDSLGDGLLAQARAELAAVARQAAAALPPLDGEGAARIGRELDELRGAHDLALAAVFDGRGGLEHVSPVSTVVEDLPPFTMQRISAGLAPAALSAEGGDAGLLLVEIVRLEPAGLGAPPPLLWIEASLPPAAAADIRAIEQVGQAYKAARSMRAGVRQAIYIICYNIVSMLLLLAISMSVYTGSRLGRRLGELSGSMRAIAAMEHPQGEAPETKNDEVTAVARSFNALVAKVSATLGREKRIREELELIQESLDAGVLVIDGADRVRRCNEAARRILGLNPLEHPATLESMARRRRVLQEFCEAAAGGGRHSGEIAIGPVKLWLHVEPRESGEGRVVMVTDISQPMAYEQMRAKQEAFGYTLHGLKNPLQPLLYHAQALAKLDEAVPDPAARAQLVKRRDAILHNIERINEQVDSMRSMTSEAPKRYVRVDLNRHVERFVKHRKPSGADIKTALAAELPAVMYDENELKDAIENLYTNAEEQFKQNRIAKQELIIRTQETQEVVELIFEDNAGGIPEDVMPQIFKPHVSYKTGGQGIGLARIKRAIEGAGGSIAAANVQGPHGPGARFVLRFPPAHD